MEALHSPKAKNLKYSQSESHNYDPKSKNKIDNSTESVKLLSKKTDPPNIVLVEFLHNDSDNVFEDDVIVTKEKPQLVFHFKPLTFKSREEVGPLVSINHIDPLSTQKFTNIGNPLTGAPKKGTSYQWYGSKLFFSSTIFQHFRFRTIPHQNTVYRIRFRTIPHQNTVYRM